MADGNAAPKRRKMPAQKPRTSKQDYSCPWPFIDAVEHHFGKLEWDLAASEDNCVVRNAAGARSRQFFSEEEDSLAQNWSAIGGLQFLNPPFDNITAFAKKCAEEASPRSPILLLTPASVGANWFWEHVRPNAVVYATDRIQFVGAPHVYPKDLMISHFIGGAQGFGRWRWTKEIAKGARKK